MKSETYRFPACERESECTKFVQADREYARVYINITSYGERAVPCQALDRGTLFDALYMPYGAKGVCCNEM